MKFVRVTATTTFEVSVALKGTFLPAIPERGPTYDCGGTPAEPESMEDVEVLSLDGLRRSAGGWTSTDLLAGLAPDAKRLLLANISDFLGDEAQDALLAEVPEAE